MIFKVLSKKSAAIPIATFLMAAMLGGILLPPLTAYAIPVIVTGDPYTIAEIAQSIIAFGQRAFKIIEAIYQSAQAYLDNIYKFILKPAIKMLAARILQALTQSIIQWIQGGGNTNFVSNLEAALGRAGDEAAGEFLNQLAGTNLCEPFSLRVKLAFTFPSFRSRLACSATDIMRNLNTSYNQFLRDFRSGGWIAFQTTLVDSNNYIDALVNSYDAKLQAESRRTTVLQEQYKAGQGFLGIRVKKKVCNGLDDNGVPDCKTVDVQTTPGTLVNGLLKDSVGSGIQQAVNINDIGLALDSIISALITKLISSAAAGLLGNNEESGLYANALLGADLLPPPPPPPPNQISVQTDISRINRSLTVDVIPSRAIATSTILAIENIVTEFAPRASLLVGATEMLSRLNIIKTELAIAEATLLASKNRLESWRTELQDADAQTLLLLSNPEDPNSALLSQIFPRTRQISNDITGEIQNSVSPEAVAVGISQGNNVTVTAARVRTLAAEANTLIRGLRTAPSISSSSITSDSPDSPASSPVTPRFVQDAP